MKAKVLNFVRGLRNGTPPRFQSYLKSLTLIFTLLLSVNVWGTEAALTSVSTKNVVETKGESVSLTFGDVTCNVTRNSANQPGFYTSSGIVRYYSTDVMTLSVPSGSTISKIVFVMTSGTVGTASPTGLSSDSKTWEGNANSVSFTGSATVKITSITVTYSSASSKKTVLYSGQKSGQFQPSFLALSQIVILGFFAFFCKKFSIYDAWRMHGGSRPSSQPLFSPFGTLFAQPPFLILIFRLLAATPEEVVTPMRRGETQVVCQLNGVAIDLYEPAVLTTSAPPQYMLRRCYGTSPPLQ